jgi:hypothetical protein
MKRENGRFPVRGTQTLRTPSSLSSAPRPTRHVKLLPLGWGTRAALSSSGLPLKQSSPCADRAPFPPLQPGAPDVPAMFAHEGDSPSLGSLFTLRGVSADKRLRGPGSGGRRHGGNAPDVDGMRVLLAEDNITVGRVPALQACYGRVATEGARRSRPPQMDVCEHGDGRPTNDQRK